MLVTILKWTQLAVAVAATVLAGLIWPGIMVVIPVAMGVAYAAFAAGAIRNHKPSIWIACALSIAVAMLSTGTLSANGFAILNIEREMGPIPPVAVSSGGDVVMLDSIPESAREEIRRIHASAVRRQEIIATLLLLVSVGSCAVVLLHGVAWRWMISGATAKAG